MLNSNGSFTIKLFLPPYRTYALSYLPVALSTDLECVFIKFSKQCYIHQLKRNGCFFEHGFSVVPTQNWLSLSYAWKFYFLRRKIENFEIVIGLDESNMLIRQIMFPLQLLPSVSLSKIFSPQVCVLWTCLR